MRFATSKLALFIIAGALIFGASAGANAASGYPQGPGYEMRPYNPDLAPQQAARAQQIYNELAQKSANVQQGLDMKQGQLDQQLASPNPDKGAIKRLSREIGELRGQLLAAQAEARAKLAQSGIQPDDQANYNYWHCPGMMGYGQGGYYHRGGRHGGHHWRDYWTQGNGSDW